MSELFRMDNVTFAHMGRKQPVLDEFNLVINEGERTAVLGANGVGKTTMFYSLTGVYKPQGGQILYRGEPIEYSIEGLRNLRSDVAVVLQNPDEQIFCSIVEEDVAFGPLNLGMERDEVEVRVEKALRDVRMSEYAKRPMQQLSGGQKKRVAIAGALAMHPKIMIMDEPTAGLDPQASMEVMELAEKLSLEGVTVMISTHDLDIVYGWAEKTDIIYRGKIEFSGPADSFYSDRERAYGCGLLVPSLFEMNHDTSARMGADDSPYPHTRSEFVAKFGKSNHFGRIVCVSAEPEDAVNGYESADCGMAVGIYGSDVRGVLTEKSADFMFDALDSCLSEAVMGRDAMLICDPVYVPAVKKRVERLREFGADIVAEGLR